MKKADNTLNTLSIKKRRCAAIPNMRGVNTHALKTSLTFSVIVPIPPEHDMPLVLKYMAELNAEKNIEVILAKGRQPSRQRNTAAKAAKGDILVFLDDDSCPDADFFERLAYHFKDPEVVGVGGPNLALPTEKFTPNLANAVLTSRIGVLSKRSRYESFGRIRRAGDSDLILCNFAILRKVFVESGGFCEKLYPNEENEFFERFAKNDFAGIILYDPRLIVRRPRLESIQAFLKKICGYGKGRAQQFKCRKSLWSLVHIFGCMVFVIPVVLVLAVGFSSLLYLFSFYGAALVFRIFSCLFVHKRISIALMIAPATIATHVSYVIGLWKGLLSHRPANFNTDIQLKHLTLSKCKKLTCYSHRAMETANSKLD